VRHAPRLKAALIRAGLFMLFSSSLWALLPLVVRYELGGSPPITASSWDVSAPAPSVEPRFYHGSRNMLAPRP